MRDFNLSAWALGHRTLVLFLLIVATIAGVIAFGRLGRAEDPNFTFKVMIIRTSWPGATAREVERLVTEPVEKKLEEVPYYDYAQSYSRPGESVVFLMLKDITPPRMVPDLWYQARKKIGDMKGSLPSGVQGPYFNDEFGDVYSDIYTLSGEANGFSPAQLKKVAEEARSRLLGVSGVLKVDLIGLQDEKIYVEISNRRLASFGLPVQTVIDAIRRENPVAAAGDIDVGPDRVFVRIDVGFDRLAAIRDAPLVAGDGRQVTVGDVADVWRGYADPKSYVMRFHGQESIGLGVVMAKGGNVVDLGKRVAAEIQRIRADLPAGIEVGHAADQGRMVDESVGEFLESLAEALGIVIAVSFLSLGWRPGLVVAVAVPLVLGMTMVAMLLLGIDLQRISLGALIIALGLLVDDAIISTEMMAVKINQGWDRLKAGAFAYRSTAFPMLTGTVITAAGFVPVGFAQSNSGEYCNSMFWVLAAALLASWIVAVLFTPYVGYHLLKRSAQADGEHLYDTPMYKKLRRAVETCLRHRWPVIGLTVALFAAAVAGFGFVPQQFFPASNRLEILIDLRLAEGSSFAATEREVKKMEEILRGDAEVDHWVAYVGGGSPRFYMPLDQQLQTSNFGQFVVIAKGIAERERIVKRVAARADSDFPNVRLRVTRLEIGPPVGYPVQFRVTGSDPTVIRAIAAQVREVMRANPLVSNVNYNWDELSKRVRVEADPAKARALGVAKQDLAEALQLMLSGLTITQYREGTQLVDVVMRSKAADRLDLSQLGELTIATPHGPVPLSQVATLHYEQEEPVLWRRSRLVCLTVRGDVTGRVPAPTVSQQLDRRMDAVRATLPDGYSVDMGGAIEESAKGQGSINAMLPLMVLIMIGTLMVQLQNFSRMVMVLLTAPLGLIGVTAALLLSGRPFGFVATLGVIALAGIIMRNSVILVDQIDQDQAAGRSPWESVVEATVRRARPIALTAAAAILAMIPLTFSTFWGPMATAMMGGLTVATVLTIFFLPALYAAWFRIRG